MAKNELSSHCASDLGRREIYWWLQPPEGLFKRNGEVI